MVFHSLLDLQQLKMAIVGDAVFSCVQKVFHSISPTNSPPVEINHSKINFQSETKMIILSNLLTTANPDAIMISLSAGLTQLDPTGVKTKPGNR